MDGAWTHEQIISAWYWRAQRCYYSFVILTTPTSFNAGPALANLPEPSSTCSSTKTAHSRNPVRTTLSLHLNSPTHCISDNFSIY
jgi:hypothetical protein